MQYAYDVCIIGAGMIGSAAARHASLTSPSKVCLIGPAEPKVKKVITGNEVFGAHYDEGRMTRPTSLLPIWGLLAQRSIARYREIEKQSGIHFYHEVGGLMVGTANSPFITSILHFAEEHGHMENIEVMDNSSLRKKYPYMHFAPDDVGILESKHSGHINPRKLVAAQTLIASQQGCDVIRSIVTDVSKEDDGIYNIVCENGIIVRSCKVLLATNVFTALHNLLNDSKPAGTFLPHTVSNTEVSEKDVDMFRGMPTVLYDGKGNPNWPSSFPRNSSGNIGFAMLPPLLYPDGKCYLKLYSAERMAKNLSLTLSEVRQWHCSEGDKEIENHLHDITKALFPDASFPSHYGTGCVTMSTPTFHPYVDLISPTFGVILGDNGWAGKSSDELGKMAAEMIIASEWTYDLPRDKFRLVHDDTVQY